VREALQIQRNRMFRSAVTAVLGCFTKLLQNMTKRGLKSLKEHSAAILNDVSVVWEPSCDLSLQEKQCILAEIKPLNEYGRLQEKNASTLLQSIDKHDQLTCTHTGEILLPVLDNDSNTPPTINANVIREIMTTATADVTRSTHQCRKMARRKRKAACLKADTVPSACFEDDSQVEDAVEVVPGPTKVCEVMDLTED